MKEYRDVVKDIYRIQLAGPDVYIYVEAWKFLVRYSIRPIKPGMR